MEDDGRWNRDEEWDNLWTYDEEEWVPPEVDQVDDRDIEYVWNRLQTDIPFFADFMFDIDLGLRQRQFAWSAVNNRHTLFLSTRQGGKSTMLAVLNAHQMTFAPNTFIEAYAPSFDQARGVIYERTKALFESQEWLYEQIGKIKETGEIRMLRRHDWRQTHPNYLQIHTANKATAYNAQECDAITVSWIHVCLDLKDEPSESVVAWLYGVSVRQGSGARWRRQVGEET